MVHMIWEKTELPEKFKQRFPLYQEKTPFFFLLDLVEKHVFVWPCMHEFVCLGRWGKHKTIARIYIF